MKLAADFTAGYGRIDLDTSYIYSAVHAAQKGKSLVKKLYPALKKTFNIFVMKEYKVCVC